MRIARIHHLTNSSTARLAIGFISSIEKLSGQAADTERPTGWIKPVNGR
jgi:hypothetical protein